MKISNSENPNDSVSTCDESLLAKFKALWQASDDLWDSQQNEAGFSRYVSADFPAVLESLLKLQGRYDTFLEWGSGLGVATIMASCLGFDAYGIEAEPALVEHARSFASDYGPQAKFGTGSFIPDEFDWNPAIGDANRTIIDSPSGYDDLGMALSEFELIYAYPWPDEHSLYHDILREHGNENALLLSYDTREGIQLVQFGDLSSKQT